MDTKNVIAAISLSAAVIILYSLFFQPDPATIKQNLAEQNKIENNKDTPSLDKNEDFSKLSRADALKENDRIQFENGSVVGSISLKGAAIDDLTFKEYNIELNKNEKIDDIEKELEVLAEKQNTLSKEKLKDAEEQEKIKDEFDKIWKEEEKLKKTFKL